MMPIREPKSKTVTMIDVIGRAGDKKGRFEFSSGNLYYYRAGANSETIRMSYQQLITLLEKEIEYQEIDTEDLRLPKPHQRGDFKLDVAQKEIDGSAYGILHASAKWKNLDSRFTDIGRYELSNWSVRTNKKRYPWCVWISVQANLWMLACYIDKWLTPKTKPGTTNDDIVISKNEMRQVLLGLLKKLD